MSTIGSATTPPVTTTTAPVATTKPAEPAATTTPATAATVDAFEKPAEAPVALTTPFNDDEEWADGPDWQGKGSGGGGIAEVDPNFGRPIRG